MQTRLFRTLSLALLIVFASAIAGCGGANVDVEESVSTSTPADSGTEACCGSCCDKDDAATASLTAAKTECCGECAKTETTAAKECCGKCDKDSSKTQLVTTEAKACEYCKEGTETKACEECTKQKTQTVSTEAKKQSLITDTEQEADPPETDLPFFCNRLNSENLG
eukprot:TRINITY_DN42981_c0_g1_i2.p2 TRINITY_DN42981_c0_g1~~TRINITY_DN42981_c0_g1_i2.p2  ORF type:complete len:193 (-),score=15.33 TRINITY_DN42981_c0_g1_i2:156-656(-)